MNLRLPNQVITTLILLVTAGLVSGCSAPETPEILEKPSIDIALSEINPAGDSADIAEGLTQPYSDSLENAVPKAIIPPTNPEASTKNANQLESPSLKSAPTSDQQPETQTAPPPAQESSAAAAAAPAGEPNIGFQAPEFSLETVDGQAISLAELRGKNVLLNYWVTWCIPCLEEMPVLEKLHQEYQAQNLVVLSVNGIKQDELDTVMATLGEFAVTFPVALDQSSVVYDSYRVQFMPTSFFIDDQGVIRYIQLGSSNEEGLRTKIEQLISDQL